MDHYLKKNYHWLLATIVFLEMIVYGGIINSYSIYTVPVTEDFSIGRGLFSISDLVYSILSFLSTIAVGSLFPKYGYRKTATVSLLLSVAALLLMSVAPNLVVYGISRALFGIGFGACFTAGAVRIIRSWFFQHQGLVLGAITMASGIGGSILAPILTEIIVTSGWRSAARCAALMLLVIAGLYLLLRDDPEELGLKPLGFGSKDQKKSQNRLDWAGFPRSRIIRMPMFYLTCLATLLTCICIYTTSQTMIPFFRDSGYSPEKAAAFGSISMLILAISKLLAGWFADRFGGKRLSVICILCAAIGQLLLLRPDKLLLAYAGVVIFSVGICMTSIAIPLLTRSLFGCNGSTDINSIVISFSSLAVAISTPLTNFARDSLGSYLPAYRIALLADLTLIVLYLYIFYLAKNERIRYTQ